MARFRYEPQACFPMSLAPLHDRRLRRGSAFAVYTLAVAAHTVNAAQIANTLGLTESTVKATLRYICRSGWALELGSDYLLLDLPLHLTPTGAIRESDYAKACIKYALGLAASDGFVTQSLTPEQRRAEFRVISSSDGGKVIT